MNTGNCSFYFATDEVVLKQGHAVACAVFLPLYIGLFATLSAVRTLGWVLQIKVWKERYMVKAATTPNYQGAMSYEGGGQTYSPAASPSSKRTRRLPIIPAFHILAVVSIILFTVLTPLGIANSGNNVTIALISLYFLPSFVNAHIAFLRIVKLGKNIIPLSVTSLDVRRNTQVFSRLDKKSKFLNFVRFALILSYWMNLIAIFVFGFIFPGHYAPVAVGFSCYIFQCAMMVCGLDYQYERLIRAVRAFQKNSNGAVVNSSQETQQNSAVNKSIKRFRLHQITFFILGLGGGLVWLFPTTTLVPFDWW